MGNSSKVDLVLESGIFRFFNIGLIAGRVGIIGMVPGVIFGGELAMYVGLIVGGIVGFVAGVLGLLKNGNATITSVLHNLSSRLKTEVEEYPLERQAQFLEEYRRNQKRIWIAYLCSLGGGAHYDYLGKNKLGALMTITILLGVGIVWWLVDIFRIPGMVQEHNRDAAEDLVLSMRIRE